MPDDAEIEAWHGEPCEVCGGTGEMDLVEPGPFPSSVLVPCPYCASPEPKQ